MVNSNCAQRVELEIVRGQAQQRHRPVTGPAFLIGTSSECDLVLSAAQFSEVYACLVVLPSQVTMRQLGDGPAILINGQPASDARLLDGDRIAAGPFEFVVHIAATLEHELLNYVHSSRPTNRWSTTPRVMNPTAMRAAVQLISDIRTALDEQRPAMRRPA
ncbi:MAG TPA: FHA domain-containing protein [Lacipirellulaceae bacterium]|jgi:pSer/pThr/pTyr-binding forkhead associated (FHA) protein|nr:FHA domain-containing protein [Lacipirellulaceae bacterium]